jgi:DNA-binding transcriptional MocR family regulator
MALERHRPRLIYVQPTFQNPTTRVMGETRRRELLEVAARFRCPVVEDDWAGDLRFEGENPPSLYALDGGRHVIYLSTFSKKLMPGLRIGWIAAPSPALERLVELKRIQDCGTSPFLQAVLDAFIRSGGLRRHLELVRPVYVERRDRMMGALQSHFPVEASWTRPAGGLFVWVTLPEGFDGHELFVAARQGGVLYSRGDLFSNDGGCRNSLRIAYAATPPEQIERGIRILGNLVTERLDHGRPAGTPAIEAMPIL